jgi:hypothetical protein
MKSKGKSKENLTSLLKNTYNYFCALGDQVSARFEGQNEKETDRERTQPPF